MLTVKERIKQFNAHRDPVYLPKKYELMIKDPFVFFRGSCHLFYEDLYKSGKIASGPKTWICGDLHLENFGSYKGDNRLVYFDITDFDEGILAPATWELARIVTSIFIALDKPANKLKETTAIAKLFLQRYAEILLKGKARYIEQQTAIGITRSFLDKVCERKQKDLIEKRTTTDKEGRLSLKIDNDKLFAIKGNLKGRLMSHLNQWIQNSETLSRDFQAVDASIRIAGTGSIGIKRYLFLLKEVNAEKYLLIDMKQAMPSSLTSYSPGSQPAWPSEAERIAAIQYRMQNIPPALLSTTIFDDSSYLLKEMQPTEDKITFKLVRDDYEETAGVIKDFALLTSSAHLRSAGRQGAACPDELIAFGGNHEWLEEVSDYAINYAQQVKRDHQAFVDAFNADYFS